MRRQLRKATRFYPIYSRQVEQAIQASARLTEMFHTEDREQWKRLEKEVKNCEKAGDAALAEFHEQVYETKLLLSGKADLQSVANHIDDFLDHIDDSAKALLLYLPDHISPQLQEMAQFIEEEASVLDDIVNLLISGGARANASAISMQCEKVTELEHLADASYEEFIAELFANCTDAVQIIKNKNIAEYLEETSDSAKRITDHMRTILMRYLLNK